MGVYAGLPILNQILTDWSMTTMAPGLSPALRALPTHPSPPPATLAPALPSPQAPAGFGTSMRCRNLFTLAGPSCDPAKCCSSWGHLPAQRHAPYPIKCASLSAHYKRLIAHIIPLAPNSKPESRNSKPKTAPCSTLKNIAIPSALYRVLVLPRHEYPF